jgi:hypothetical protein
VTDLVERLREFGSYPADEITRGCISKYIELCRLSRDRIETLEAEITRLQRALEAIVALEERPFEGMPADWSEQIDGCEDCQRYAGHPIQQGICDTHRRPLWDREAHQSHEEKALGSRAKIIARAALGNQPRVRMCLPGEE